MSKFVPPFEDIDGEVYTDFCICEKDKINCLDAGSLYAFLTKISSEKYEVLYIGQSGEVVTRLVNHEKWSCVNRLGCSHIAVRRTTGGRDYRCKIEESLIRNYNPPCNVQHTNHDEDEEKSS